MAVVLTPVAVVLTPLAVVLTSMEVISTPVAVVSTPVAVVMNKSIKSRMLLFRVTITATGVQTTDNGVKNTAGGQQCK